MDSDIVSFNKYEVVFRGFLSKDSLITEDDSYTTLALNENEAGELVYAVNESRDEPLSDIKVVSISIVP